MESASRDEAAVRGHRNPQPLVICGSPGISGPAIAVDSGASATVVGCVWHWFLADYRQSASRRRGHRLSPGRQADGNRRRSDPATRMMRPGAALSASATPWPGRAFNRNQESSLRPRERGVQTDAFTHGPRREASHCGTRFAAFTRRVQGAGEGSSGPVGRSIDPDRDRRDLQKSRPPAQADAGPRRARP
jgi:hypothetical protein